MKQTGPNLEILTLEEFDLLKKIIGILSFAPLQVNDDEYKQSLIMITHQEHYLSLLGKISALSFGDIEQAILQSMIKQIIQAEFTHAKTLRQTIAANVVHVSFAGLFKGIVGISLFEYRQKIEREQEFIAEKNEKTWFEKLCEILKL